MTTPPVTFEHYLQELESKISWLEGIADKAHGFDERQDVTNKLLIETVKILREGLKVQLPPTPDYFPTLPSYNIRKYLLDTARTAPGEEINLPGDTITAYTDGALAGCFIRLDSPTNDAIPLNEFNPYTYKARFQKFWLETTSQTGKYLRLHIGREAGAEASVQITAVAAKQVFYTIRSDKDTHFTGALAQYVKEDENITGLLANKIRVTGISLQADELLRFKLLFWKKDSFDDTNLDLDMICGEVDVDLPIYGYRIGGAGQYYLDVRGIELDYEDEDGSNELHVSLYNMSVAAKTAGAAGEVAVDFYYEPRA